MEQNNHQQREQLNLQLNAEETHKQDSSKILERIEIEGTPFVIVKQDGETFLTLGTYKIKNETQDEKELKRLIHDKDWKTILDVISIAIDIRLKNK